MESEDDIYLIIVGHDVETSLQIKEEPPDDEMYQNSIYYLDIENEISISQEEQAMDEETISVKEECTTDHADGPDNLLDHEVPIDKPLPKKWLRKIKPSKRFSYVKSLKKVYPELKADKELLLDTLVSTMKETKPPPLPKDYYVMDDIMLKCLHCNHKSVSIPAAMRHYQETHGERYLLCLACGFNFRSKTNLYKHEKICDEPDAMIVLEARARFLGPKARSRPFLCKQPKGKQKQNRKMFQCTICPARFKVKTGLTAHQHMHTGHRPYVCRTCNRGYTCSSALGRHRQKHVSSEPFVCEHCGRSFSERRFLIAHLDTHLPQRRFACAECGRRFAQRASLQIHVDREHRGLPPPFPCELCPKRYPRLSKLKEHMQKAHGLNIMTRKMYFKALPTLTNVRVPLAKLVKIS